MLNKPFLESELILNNRGGIYHLDLLPEEISTNILVVGDPDRVAIIAARFDSTDFIKKHREFASARGRIGSKTFTIISTGIGTDNIDIVWNELDALANIDFASRQVKPNHTKLNVFRLGTCGALKENILPGELILSTHSVGLDNLKWFYQDNISILPAFHEALAKHASNIGLQVQPYVTEASEYFTQLFRNVKHQGVTLTAPGFYGPQGRSLRLSSNPINGISDWSSFEFNQQTIYNFEMETSALFYLGKRLNHHVGALCVALANRKTKQFHKQPEKAVSRLIDEAFTVLTT